MIVYVPALVKRILVVIPFAVSLVACGGGESEDAGAFCTAVEDMYAAVQAGLPDDLADLAESADRLEDIETRVREEAPSSIQDDVAVLFDSDPESIRASEIEAREEARDEVNAFVHDECDLVISL